MSYDVLVAPTDGSDPAEAGIERAVGLARELGSTVHALFVVDEGDRPGDWDVVVERQEAAGEAALDSAFGIGADAGVAVERHLRRGRPAEAIVAFAAECDADAVVMGTHGRSGFDRIRHAGSTTERVLRSATIPVLAVPPAGAGA